MMIDDVLWVSAAFKLRYRFCQQIDSAVLADSSESKTLSLLCTCCGQSHFPVDGLWPNPEWNRYEPDTECSDIFVP